MARIYDKARIGELFRIETGVRDHSAEEHRAIWQAQSRLVLTALEL